MDSFENDSSAPKGNKKKYGANYLFHGLTSLLGYIRHHTLERDGINLFDAARIEPVDQHVQLVAGWDVLCSLVLRGEILETRRAVPV